MDATSTSVTVRQVRAARALLGWTQQELSARANVSSSTIADFERGKRSPVPNNLEAVRSALENGGITFLPGGAVTGTPIVNNGVALAPSGEPIRLIEATDLSQWAERHDSQDFFPQLIQRLILATTNNSFTQLKFPSLESIQHEGWDGICEQYAVSRHASLPFGKSGWELSTQKTSIQSKADADYEKRTLDPRELQMDESTFVFATLKRWHKGRAWTNSKRGGNWADVRTVDADDFADWIQLYPAVAYWLASHIGKLPSGILPLTDSWQEWRSATKWHLTPEIVLSGRDSEAIELLKWLRAAPSVRSIQADSPDEAIAFLYAAIDLLPEPHRSFYLMRSLRAYNADAARTIGASASPLIVLMEASDPGLASRLTQRGHHVFLAYGSAVGLSEVSITLPKALHEAFQGALEDMGVPDSEAIALTRDSIRSIAVLRRLIPSASVRNPDWAEDPKGRSLVAALLAGGWDASRAADRGVLEQLSGEDFDRFDVQCALFTGFPDAPLRHAGSAWKVASPRDSWFRLARLIVRSDLERFASIAQSILGSADPRFALAPKERWLAPVRGQLPSHSQWLSAGLTETLLLLAMFPECIKTVADADKYPGCIVHNLLQDADAQRWYSLSRHLRTLAEAAPDQFLSAIESSLDRDDTPVMCLFQEDGGPLMGGANHSDLLWALEILAWCQQYLPRVAQVLARLSALDPPGGKWANRPKSSLQTIFLLWKPQTNATLTERVKVIDHLRMVEPDEAWKLMLSLLPAGPDFMSPTPQPRWRDFSVASPEQVTYGLIAQGVAALSKRIVEDAGADSQRWIQAIEALPKLPTEWRTKLIRKLDDLAGYLAEDELKLPIWTALRALLSHHRSFPAAKWSMEEIELQEIESVYQKFQPHDEISRRVWLFSDRVQLTSGERIEDWDARMEDILARRRQAIAEIVAICGVGSLCRVANESLRPYWAGFAYGQAVDDLRQADTVIEHLAGEPEQAVRDFTHGVVAALHHRLGRSWSSGLLERARRDKWDESKISAVLLALPTGKETWDIVASFGDGILKDYWEHASIFWNREDTEEMIYGVEQLLKARRAIEAIDLIAGFPQALPSDLIIQILAQAAEEWSTEDNERRNGASYQWAVCQLLRRLDDDPSVAEVQIARLEWTYLAVLEYAERPPVVLHRLMSSDPAFFVQVLSAVYRPHSGSNTEKTPVPPEVERTASHAFRLLQSWNIVPGTTATATDAATLTAWVKKAHRLATQSERGAVGDVHIGHVLSLSKADPDGTWPERAVRDVIELMTNDHLENGMVSGVHNKQGVTTRGLFEGGQLERGVANQYRMWADAVKFEWPRTAALLERIARSFEDTAKFHDEHAELTDWSY